MARLTVDDCLKYVDNRFNLVLLASKRARQLELGGYDPIVDRENDKPTVLALREIATGQTNFPERRFEEEALHIEAFGASSEASDSSTTTQE